MLRLKFNLWVRRAVRVKCLRHPCCNLERDGADAIRGGCATACNKCRKQARGVYYGAVFEIKKEISDDGHIDSRVQKCPLLSDRISADHQ